MPCQVSSHVGFPFGRLDRGIKVLDVTEMSKLSY